MYLTKLAVQAEGSSTYDFIDLSGNSSNVKYPLWKLNYYTVKSYSENSITLSNDATVNFNTAASALIYTSWDGGGSISSTPNLQIETRTTPTGTPINQRNISFSANSGTGNESPTSGKTITINSFDANAKAKAWMNASIDSSTSRLFTVNIDASSILSSVVLNGNWSGNSSSGWTFTTTNTANSRTTATTIGRQFSPSSGWNANWKKQITITGTGQGLLYQWTEDASDAYDAGVTDGEAKFTEYTGQKYRVSNGNFRDYTLYYRTKNPDESYSFYKAGTGTGFVQVAEIADTLYTKSEE
ncbi:MAG: hypothetical protein II676_05500 [Bacteroidales bacterium]|nr:hypothetical protein [Bacteroidales bacterium]